MTPANIAGATTKNSAEPRTAVIFDMRPPNVKQAVRRRLTHANNYLIVESRLGVDRVRAMVIFHAALQWTTLETLAPTVAAVVTHHVAVGDYRAFRFRTTWSRTLGATVVGVILMVPAFVVLPAVTTADPRTLHWGILTSGSVYNYSTLLGGELFEEPG
jgi:hypothetical protein